MRKIITVLIHQIRLNIAHCKAIFSLYIVSLIVINYIVCFLYGAFNIHILEKRSEDLAKCTYLIDYKNPEKFENVQKLKSINYVGSSRFYIYESLFETEENFFRIRSSETSELPENLLLAAGRRNFTETELTGDVKSAIVSPNLGKLGDRISLSADDQYLVVGVLDTPQENLFYIPFRTYQELNLDVHRFTYIVKNKLTAKEQEEMLHAIDDSNINMISFYNSAEQEMKQAVLERAGFTIIFIVINFSFLFLLQFISDKTKKSYILYGILGAERSTIFLILYIERIFYVSLTMMFSSLLHFVTKDAFHKIMNLPGSKMEFVDYVVINLIEIVSVFIVSLPFVISFFKKSYTTILKENQMT